MALVVLFLASGLNLAMPELARRMLSMDSLSQIGQRLHLWLAVAMGLFVLQGACNFIRSYLFNRIGQRVYATVRSQLFASILARDVPFFDAARAGELAARINSDAALIQDAVSVKASVLIRYTVQVVLGVVLMVWMSWRLTTAIVLSLGVLVLVSVLYAKKLRAAAREYQSRLAELVALATETFAAARVVQSLGARQEIRSRFDGENQRALAAGELRGTCGAAFASGASLLLNLLLVGVAWYGLSLVLAQELPLNDLAAFVLYGGIVAASSAFLVGGYAELMQSFGGLQRVFELLEWEKRHNQESPTKRLKEGRGPTVRLQAVSLSYSARSSDEAAVAKEQTGTASEVLHNLSLTLEGGKVSAIAGPSGVGKSSLVNLLLRFYAPSRGAIWFDDAALAEISEEELRACAAWVPHDPPLLSLSIRENLLLGNSLDQQADLEALLKGWPFMNFLWDMPQGLTTVVGENGFQLSTGQRQRVAIARALLRRPRLLILDEATSGLDRETEESVFSVLKAFVPDATVLLISHRAATLAAAEKVFVMQGGTIVEEGGTSSQGSSTDLVGDYAANPA